MYCQLLKKYPNEKLHNVLNYIMDKYCQLFYNIYQQIYTELKLGMYKDRVFYVRAIKKYF